MRVRYKGRVWDKTAIQHIIDTNDAAVSRALMIVYNNQTAGEKSCGETIERNDVGFTGRDAEFLTDIALKWQHYGRWASRKQLNAVRRAIRKYHRQVLLDMSQREGAEIVRGRLPKEEQPQALDMEARALSETQRQIEGVQGTW